MDNLSFLAASRLWLLALPMAFLGAYVVSQLRRRGYVVKFTNLDLLDAVAPKRPAWRRHLPASALVVGLAAAVVAFARPAVADEVASSNAVVILAIDTSLSMKATDVAPSRVTAAKEAAGSFLASVPDGVKVGVVAFNDSARQAIAPTANLAAVQRTIDRLALGQGTAIGEAVFTSLDAIEETFETGQTADRPAGQPAPGTIVLLSDGETTAGRPNDEAAAAAKKAGIAVNTIAFGTDKGTVMTPDGETVGVPVNKADLADLARSTGGQTLTATNADQLKQVYEALGKAVTTEPVTREVTDWFTFAALVIVALGAAGSLLWFSRLP
ncbi:MAG TPA: VWA domain-containing protein [Acidimicrobiales bacterium]